MVVHGDSRGCVNISVLLEVLSSAIGNLTDSINGINVTPNVICRT